MTFLKILFTSPVFVSIAFVLWGTVKTLAFWLMPATAAYFTHDSHTYAFYAILILVYVMAATIGSLLSRRVHTSLSIVAILSVLLLSSGGMAYGYTLDSFPVYWFWGVGVVSLVGVGDALLYKGIYYLLVANSRFGRYAHTIMITLQAFAFVFGSLFYTAVFNLNPDNMSNVFAEVVTYLGAAMLLAAIVSLISAFLARKSIRAFFETYQNKIQAVRDDNEAKLSYSALLARVTNCIVNQEEGAAWCIKLSEHLYSDIAFALVLETLWLIVVCMSGSWRMAIAQAL